MLLIHVEGQQNTVLKDNPLFIQLVARYSAILARYSQYLAMVRGGDA